MMDLVPGDLEEEILVRMPSKSILRFKTVSKQWRSIVESRSFAEKRRMLMKNVEKKPQILAVAGDHHTMRLLKREEEVDMFYLQCDAAAKRPSLTCDGLVCIPVPGWINVLNPSTGELLKFPSGPDPVKTDRYDQLYEFDDDPWWDTFPGYWAMGFGRDTVTGSYKVVRMFFDTNQTEILHVNTGLWRTLPSTPPYYVEARRKSAYVNGSIYWLEYLDYYKILAFDLHTEQFRDVPTPPIRPIPSLLGNLQGRLTISIAVNPPFHWELQIWTIDSQEETWSKTYTIRLFSTTSHPRLWRLWCRPLTVSKQGNLFFHDSKKRLFKYYPETGLVQCISVNICVLSPFVENLLLLQHSDSTPTFGFQYLDREPGSRISKFFGRIELRKPDIVVATTVAAFVIFSHYLCRF